ncbi:MAG: nucleotide exchange factor GrpE [Dehalococcoidia bacterium]
MEESEERTEGDPPPAAEAPAEESIESLKARLEEERAKAEKYLSNWQRAEADFANFKRRTEQERGENRRFASASLIINVLPILDDLERALASLDARLSGLSWFDGIRLIHRKLQLILENAGVTAIQAEGQRFDPRVHEAVQYGEGEEGKVLAEVQRGYKLYDRVLRPAMVIVGKGKGEKQPEEGGAGEEKGQG